MNWILLAGDLIKGIINGVTAMNEEKKLSELEETQIDVLTKQLATLDSQIKTKAIEKDEAFKRLNSFIKNTSGKIREVSDSYLNQGLDKIQTAYAEAKKIQQKQSKQALDNIKNTLIQRRLGASGFGMTAQGDLEERQSEALNKLSESESRDVANTTETATRNIMNEILGLEKYGYGQGENIQGEYEDFVNEATTQGSLITGQRDVLSKQKAMRDKDIERGTPFLTGLSGSYGDIFKTVYDGLTTKKQSGIAGKPANK